MEPSDVKYAIGLSPKVFEPQEFERRLDSVLQEFLADSGLPIDETAYKMVRSYVSAQQVRDATLFTFWREGDISKITSFYAGMKPEHKTLVEVLDQR